MKEHIITELKAVNSWFFRVMEKCIDLAANYLVKMKEDTNRDLKAVKFWYFHVMEKCIVLAAKFLVKMERH